MLHQKTEDTYIIFLLCILRYTALASQYTTYIPVRLNCHDFPNVKGHVQETCRTAAKTVFYLWTLPQEPENLPKLQ